MTEQEWLDCTDPRQMLKFLQVRASKRKLRLFAAACCRSISHLIDGERDKEAIQTLEQVADRAVKQAVLVQLRKEYNDRPVDLSRPYASRQATWVVQKAMQPREFNAAYDTAYHASDAVAVNTGEEETDRQIARQKKQAARSGEVKNQVALVHHLFGNPFRPIPASCEFPSAVFHLADALYNSENCSFALHDALLDAGHPDLAEHFRQEEWHPKGCWVVDTFLGKS